MSEVKHRDLVYMIDPPPVDRRPSLLSHQQVSLKPRHRVSATHLNNDLNRVIDSGRLGNYLHITTYTMKSIGNDSVAKIDIGTFNTTPLHEFSSPRHHNAHSIALSIRYASPPTILLGMNMLDMNIPRIRCKILSVANDGAQVDIESWEDTKLYSVGCSWLSIPPNDPDIQCGRFDTLEDHPMSKPNISTKHKVTFTHPYHTTPKVVVWLEAFSTHPGRNCRIIVEATDITPSGFTLEINTWLWTDILCATAVWLAHSADRKDIRSGAFSTDDVRPRNEPRLKNSSYIPIAGGAYSKKPHVFSALNMLDFRSGRNIRVKAHTGDMTLHGMTWHLDSGADSVCYGAGASFIILDQ
ncbi:hypothetical protein QCA50_012493 [Cerrena zonata]|uniref:H-type lectin domain-containing protein n=1 Tax=Cerrena zonata TaxID=2478898 RepID=A0AAW0FUN6_9APHY